MSGLAEHEREKYLRCWALPAYRRYSPGEQMVPLFADLCRRRGTLLDIGGGAGRAAVELRRRGWRVELMDHVDAREDRSIPLIEQCLWEPWPARHWDYGYCCDVMEHIPPEHVDDVLAAIVGHVDRAFFSICFEADHFGAAVGEPLHLTVQPFRWWVETLGRHGRVVDARDLIGGGTFLVA